VNHDTKVSQLYNQKLHARFDGPNVQHQFLHHLMVALMVMMTLRQPLRERSIFPGAMVVTAATPTPVPNPTRHGRDEAGHKNDKRLPEQTAVWIHIHMMAMTT